MSRSGRVPIPLPKGVEVKIDGRNISVKGPKGNFEHEVEEGIEVTLAEGRLVVSTQDAARDARRLHGLHRALLANCVTGATQGFVKTLELIGVGFRAAVQGDQLDLQLGFSHPTRMKIPDGIAVSVEKNTVISISGTDRQRVGQFAADIRKVRPPEVYKGKGVRYVGEYVRKKVGKAGK